MVEHPPALRRFQTVHMRIQSNDWISSQEIPCLWWIERMDEGSIPPSSLFLQLSLSQVNLMHSSCPLWRQSLHSLIGAFSSVPSSLRAILKTAFATAWIDRAREIVKNLQKCDQNLQISCQTCRACATIKMDYVFRQRSTFWTKFCVDAIFVLQKIYNRRKVCKQNAESFWKTDYWA